MAAVRWIALKKFGACCMPDAVPGYDALKALTNSNIRVLEEFAQTA